jgi:chemotaxis protein methyltransferase CheR
MFDLSSKDFHQLTQYLRKEYGLDLSEKKVLIEGRLRNHVMERGFPSFREYLESVYADSTRTEVQAMLDRITTNHTFFMREVVHFEYFRKQILPELESCVKDRDLRIWSAGCSSGEEAYSLAMIIHDYFADRWESWDTSILATDISDRVLKKAVAGIYPAEALQALPADYRLRYFRKLPDGNFQVNDTIRNKVSFGKFNLMEPSFPFRKPFHVIFCRNVMIYFDKESKERLVDNFHRSSAPGAYLFIGHSEFIERVDGRYRTVMPSIYRR